MPTIPNYGGPQVMPTNNPVTMQYRDFRGQVIDPKLDFRPLNRLFVAFRDDQDKLRVEADLTELKRYMLKRRYGSEGGADNEPEANQGWAALRGQDALAPDANGLSLADREDQNVRQFGQSLSEKLTPRQQEIFNKKAKELYVSNYGQVMSHTFQVAEQMKTSVGRGQSNFGIESAGRVAGDAAQLEFMINEAAQGAQLEYRDLSPYERNAKVLEATSKAVGNAIGAQLSIADEGNYDATVMALGILEKYKNNMTGADIIKFREEINKRMDTQKKYALNEGFKKHFSQPTQIGRWYSSALAAGDPTRTKGLSASIFQGAIIPIESGGRQFEDVRNPDGSVSKVPIIGRGLDGKRPANKAEWSFGAAQMQIGTAQDVCKREGIKWDEQRFMNDASYNQELGQLHFDYLMREYAGEPLKAVAAYHSGMGNVNKAIKRSEKEGGSWVQYLGPAGQKYVADAEARIKKLEYREVKGADGKVLNPMDSGYFERARPVATRKEIEGYLKAADPRCQADPKWLDDNVEFISIRQAREHKDWVAQQQNNLAQAIDMVAEDGGDVTRALSKFGSAMTLPVQDELKAYAKKVQIGDDSEDLRVYASLLDDKALSELSESELKIRLTAVNRQHRNEITVRWHQLQQAKTGAQNAADLASRASEAGMVLSQNDNLTFDTVSGDLKHFGGEEFRKLDDDSKNAFTGLVKHELLLEQQASGGALDFKKHPEQREQTVQRLLATKFNVSGAIWDSEKSVFKLKFSDLPNHRMGTNAPDAQDLVRQIAAWNVHKRGYNREPTEQECLEVLQKILIYRNPPLPDAEFFKGKFTQNTVTDLERRIGRKLNNAELTRAFIIDRLNGYLPEVDAANHTKESDALFTDAGSEYIPW